MRRRTLTLLEVLCSVMIVATLTAIVAPTIKGSVLSAKQAASIGNLRQIHLGMMLYREAQDPKVEFGRPSEMGLPPNTFEWNRTGGWKQAVGEPATWRSPCMTQAGSRGRPRDRPVFTDYFLYMDEVPGEYSVFEQMVKRHESNTVYVVEPWCDPSGRDPEEAAWRARRATGLRLNGKIETRTRDFSISSLDSWWH